MVADLRRIWPALHWDSLDADFPAWASAVARLVEANSSRSANLTAAYIEAFRAAEGVPVATRILLAAPPPADRIAVSLHATSVAVAKRAARQHLGQQQAMDRAFVASTGAAGRIALDGGRQTLHDTAAADPRARGRYARILQSSRPCEFCAMLATRGPVYTARSGRFEAHDHCDCGAELVYGRWDPQPQVKALSDLYQQSTASKTGPGKLVAFRAAYREHLGT